MVKYFGTEKSIPENIHMFPASLILYYSTEMLKELLKGWANDASVYLVYDQRRNF
jgi:hypothetical protein